MENKFKDHAERLNWVKNNSILDLVELFTKHKNSQGHLLALLTPDVRT